MRRSIATRYIPENSTAIDFDDIKGVVYLYRINNSYAAVAYSGRKSKSDFHYRFRTEDQRTEHIQKWVCGLEEEKKEKERRRAAQKAFKHTLEVGSIVYESYGYEQTNIIFYEVTEVVTDKTVVVRQIAKSIDEQNCSMSGYAMPIPGVYNGEAIRCRVSVGNVVKIKGRGNAWHWDGKRKYVSWYA